MYFSANIKRSHTIHAEKQANSLVKSFFKHCSLKAILKLFQINVFNDRLNMRLEKIVIKVFIQIAHLKLG